MPLCISCVTHAVAPLQPVVSLCISPASVDSTLCPITESFTCSVSCSFSSAVSAVRGALSCTLLFGITKLSNELERWALPNRIYTAQWIRTWEHLFSEWHTIKTYKNINNIIYVDRLRKTPFAKNLHMALCCQNQKYRGTGWCYGLHSSASTTVHSASFTVLGILKKNKEKELVQNGVFAIYKFAT